MPLFRYNIFYHVYCPWTTAYAQTRKTIFLKLYRLRSLNYIVVLFDTGLIWTYQIYMTVYCISPLIRLSRKRLTLAFIIFSVRSIYSTLGPFDGRIITGHDVIHDCMATKRTKPGLRIKHVRIVL